MANLSAIKLPNGVTYNLKDNGALQLTGGTVTGPVIFGDSITLDSFNAEAGVINGNLSVAGVIYGNVTGDVSGSAGSVAWSGVTGKPTATGSKVTSISITNHGTTSVGSASNWSAGSASSWTFEEKTIPNVTSAGTASSWTFEEKTIPNVTAAGSGSASLTFAMDTTDTKKLKITFSHTHTAPTIGTAIKVQSKSGGSNGTAPTLGTAIKVQSKSGGSNGTAPSLTVTSTTVVNGATHSITDNGHTHTIS